ncbi:hypothetical protein GCM10027589_12010 [Actinocorallia lasiicapitis]
MRRFLSFFLTAVLVVAVPVPAAGAPPEFTNARLVLDRPGAVEKGESVTVTGRLQVLASGSWTGVADEPVAVLAEDVLNGAGSTTAQARTRADGTFAVAFRALDDLKVTATWSYGGRYFDSAAVKVIVRRDLRLRFAPASAAASSDGVPCCTLYVSFTNARGRTWGPIPGRVYLDYSPDAKSWRTVGHTAANGHGTVASSAGRRPVTFAGVTPSTGTSKRTSAMSARCCSGGASSPRSR